jgi:hypothetical protein
VLEQDLRIARGPVLSFAAQVALVQRLTRGGAGRALRAVQGD